VRKKIEIFRKIVEIEFWRDNSMLNQPLNLRFGAFRSINGSPFLKIIS
jgi:hypothetical protein